MAARRDVCALCHRPIDYSLPYMHPGAYVLDEIKPVSKWWMYGYRSAKEAALDPDNVQPAHRRCNAERGAMTMDEWWSYCERKKRKGAITARKREAAPLDLTSEW